MTAPRQSFSPPTSSQIAGGDGRAAYAYEQFFDRLGKAMETLRQAVSDMDELDSGASTSDVVAAWNALRSKLQEIS